MLLKACKYQSSISSGGHGGASPVTTTPLNTHTHFQGINIWARVCSSGPLMADHAGAGGNTIHADEQPARRETEGVVSVKGSQESGRRWIQNKQKFLMQWLKMNQRDKGEAEGLIGLLPPLNEDFIEVSSTLLSLSLRHY